MIHKIINKIEWFYQAGIKTYIYLYTSRRAVGNQQYLFIKDFLEMNQLQGQNILKKKFCLKYAANNEIKKINDRNQEKQNKNKT